MPREDRATWKSNYFLKIIQLVDDYPKCFLAGADNVGSKQMQQTRMSLRRKAVVLMGHLENNPALEKLLPHIRGNVGFVFTKEDLTEMRDMLLADKVPAAARAGAIAPCEDTVPAQNTGLGAKRTSFFQALALKDRTWHDCMCSAIMQSAFCMCLAALPTVQLLTPSPYFARAARSKISRGLEASTEGCFA
uniref:Large ribosomal subunit protein uL10 n=2 Tax=Canis lupus familiaris TaxID=9615 RepID=A0A8P0NUS3_CANLF